MDKIKEAGIFPKIVFRGLGGRLDESRIAGSKKSTNKMINRNYFPPFSLTK